MNVFAIFFKAKRLFNSIFLSLFYDEIFGEQHLVKKLWAEIQKT